MTPKSAENRPPGLKSLPLSSAKLGGRKSPVSSLTEAASKDFLAPGRGLPVGCIGGLNSKRGNGHPCSRKQEQVSDGPHSIRHVAFVELTPDGTRCDAGGSNGR